MALSHCGISTFVDNIETDRMKEARVCNQWWDQALDFSLRDFDANFNRDYIPLALLSGTILPTWNYKYAYPSGIAAIRAILPPGIRRPTIKQRIQFEIASQDGIRIVYTDQINAVARVSLALRDISLFDATFVMAQSYLLASLIATPLTVKPAIAESNRRAYTSLSQQAIANNFNEGEEGPEPDDELNQVRNG